MNLTPRQKMFLGVLGLAVVALVVDQLIGPAMPGPESAMASDDNLLIDNAGKPAGSAAAPRTRMYTVRQQLEALRPLASQETDPTALLTDAFGMSAPIRERVTPPRLTVAEDGLTQIVRGPDRPNLRTDLRLTSILSFRDPALGAEAESVAVIDGQTRRAGDAIAGWIIREITSRSVFLEEPGDWAEHGGPRSLRLELRDPPTPGVRS